MFMWNIYIMLKGVDAYVIMVPPPPLHKLITTSPSCMSCLFSCVDCELCDPTFVVHSSHLYLHQFWWWPDSVRKPYDSDYLTVGGSEWLAIPFGNVWRNGECAVIIHLVDDRATTACTWRVPHLMLRRTLVNKKWIVSIEKGLGQTYQCS